MSLYIAIGIYFAVLLVIGALSYKRESNLNEYLLDNRRLGPVTTALSAGASDMSGWMLLGIPGALYLSGISTVWILFGLVIGAWANYRYLARRLRIYTEVADDSITIPDYLEKRFKDRTKALRIISGILILIFYTLYVSSGIIAGGKSFVSFFGLNFEYGAILTLGIVVFYTFFGGFKAVCLTDAFQGALMFAVMVAIPLMAYFSLDFNSTNFNPNGFIATINSLDSEHLNLFAGQSFLGILGLLAWGFGYFGQPHIIVRFMAIKNHTELDFARKIGISWMVISLIGASVTGLIGFVYFSQQPLKDHETVLLELGNALFHPFVLGIIISAVLAAIMSTISSQLLVSASSITRDFIFAFYKHEVSIKTQVITGRIAVVVVALIATIFAFNSTDTVLGVVGNAWAGFGASFGPVLLFSLYSRNMSAFSALVGMLVGGITVLLWISFGLNSVVYELLPGFIFSAFSIWVINHYTGLISKMNNEPSQSAVNMEFDKMDKLSKD
ncbi:MAG: sodium:proline symporter [Candidatus Campylobacter infans]|nr:MAG: sodium:proline symporter [Candidatus Campylobacter infans]